MLTDRNVQDKHTVGCVILPETKPKLRRVLRKNVASLFGVRNLWQRQGCGCEYNCMSIFRYQIPAEFVGGE